MSAREYDASTVEYLLFQTYVFCFGTVVLFGLRFKFPESEYLHAYEPFAFASVVAVSWFHFTRRRHDYLVDATTIIVSYFLMVPAMAVVELGGFGRGEFMATAQHLVLMGAYVIPAAVVAALILGFLAGRLGLILQFDN